MTNKKTSEKHMASIEFRFMDAPSNNQGPEHKSKTITIGIFDDFDTACIAGNSLLEEMERNFPLHVFPSGAPAVKERFSRHGGPFRTKKALVSDLAYLKTPFQFFAKITTLNHDDIDCTIKDILASVSRYRAYKGEQS